MREVVDDKEKEKTHVHLIGAFPQQALTWEELLDRLQVKLWVYPDRIEVRGIVPIEDIANPKYC